MEAYLLLPIIVGALVLAGLGIVLAMAQRTARSARPSQAPELAGKRPQGYWMGVGIALGLLAGYILSLTAGALSGDWQFFIILGPAVGMLPGLAIGVALEQRHRGEIRPLRAAEQRAPMGDVGRRRARRAGTARAGRHHPAGGVTAGVCGRGKLRAMEQWLASSSPAIRRIAIATSSSPRRSAVPQRGTTVQADDAASRWSPLCGVLLLSLA